MGDLFYREKVINQVAVNVLNTDKRTAQLKNLLLKAANDAVDAVLKEFMQDITDLGLIAAKHKWRLDK